MYAISHKDGAGDVLARSRADSPEEAAQRWAWRTYGRSAFANRVTGVVGMSGVFQAYVQFRTGGATSIGSPYHVG